MTEPKKETKIVRISPALSLELWSLLTYFKGRKKGIITVIATGLMLIMQDNEFAALLGGLAFESLWSVAEFFLSKIEVKE